jgi:hypothetical protein
MGVGRLVNSIGNSGTAVNKTFVSSARNSLRDLTVLCVVFYNLPNTFVDGEERSWMNCCENWLNSQM